eukprot:8450148-Pyramimonas_sp.AAC.1
MALQEAQLTELELGQELFKLHIPLLSFSSFGPQRNTGGVTVLIPCAQSGIHQRARFWREQLVPGRVQRLRISGIRVGSRQVVTSTVIYNIHNYGITRQQVQTLRQRAARGVALAPAAPDGISILLLGD